MGIGILGIRRPEIIYTNKNYYFTFVDIVARKQPEKIHVRWSGRKGC